MGYGRFQVSAELLADMLHLPLDTRIVSIEGSTRTGGPFAVIVAHDDIVSGPTPVEVNPVWHRQPEIVFDGWSQG